jgi:hypothetical protein
MKTTHCHSPTGNQKPKNKNKELAITQNKQKHKKKRPSKADEPLPMAIPLSFRKHGRRFEKSKPGRGASGGKTEKTLKQQERTKQRPKGRKNIY